MRTVAVYHHASCLAACVQAAEESYQRGMDVLADQLRALGKSEEEIVNLFKR